VHIHPEKTWSLKEKSIYKQAGASDIINIRVTPKTAQVNFK